jgi:hypothetical protein
VSSAAESLGDIPSRRPSGIAQLIAQITIAIERGSLRDAMHFTLKFSGQFPTIQLGKMTDARHALL